MNSTRASCRSGQMPTPRRFGLWGGALLVGSLLLTAACDERATPTAMQPVPVNSAAPSARSGTGSTGYGAEHQIALPSADQRLCTAVAILLDTSGSMGETVVSADGSRQSKDKIARAALDGIVAYTEQWRQAHPDRAIQLGVLHFSSSPRTALPMAAFQADRARAALASIPRPAGGTAIGDAMIHGFRALYESGCVRKYLVCITDGENTVGPQPQRVARQLFEQTQGEVEIHFVAFDTSAEYFGFLKDVNGHTVQADDGPQLATRLADIYEKRILAEAMPAERQD